MKVLIISHSVLSRTSNMGKTLSSYFEGFRPDEIAQLYIHSEVPTDDSICRNYYRITDTEAIKSIIPVKKYGKIFSEQDIDKTRISVRTDGGVKGQIYQLGRKRTGWIYLGRNTIWQLSHWFTKQLKQWLDDFSPDVIFFASGDYAFMYKIACCVSEYLKIPMVVSCVDDYYIYNKNEKSAVGRTEHRYFMKDVQRTMQKASAIFCICDLMAEKYKTLFCRPTYVLHTSAVSKALNIREDARKISYIGNLGYKRYEQLAAMGRALKGMNRQEEPTRIDVYSGERNPALLSYMTEENGIRFHGQISADDVLKVMENSMAVIHTESFDQEMRERVCFSVSTKVAESLMYGPCLLAYGPEEIASIKYLKDNHAAYVISSPEKLPEGLCEFVENTELRQEIVSNARMLGKKNHTPDKNSQLVRSVMEQAILQK